MKRGRDWKKPFLCMLGLTGVVSLSARISGVSARTARRHRLIDPAFAREWDSVERMELNRQKLADEIAAYVYGRDLSTSNWDSEVPIRASLGDLGLETTVSGELVTTGDVWPCQSTCIA